MFLAQRQSGLPEIGDDDLCVQIAQQAGTYAGFEFVREIGLDHGLTGSQISMVPVPASGLKLPV